MTTKKQLIINDIRTEVDMIAKRKQIEERRVQFEQYDTRRDIKRFTDTQRAKARSVQQQQEAQLTDTKQQKNTQQPVKQGPSILPPVTNAKKTFLGFDDTRLAQTIDTSRTQEQTSANLALSRRTDNTNMQIEDQESSTDIELPVIEKKPETWQQKMEQLKNQCMMEKEDRPYQEQMRKKAEAAAEYLKKKQQRRYERCRAIYEELVDAVVGKDISNDALEKLNQLKEEIQADVYIRTQGESERIFRQKLEKKLNSGLVLGYQSQIGDSQDSVKSPPLQQYETEEAQEQQQETQTDNDVDSTKNEPNQLEMQPQAQEQPEQQDIDETTLKKIKNNEAQFIMPLLQQQTNYNNFKTINVVVYASSQEITQEQLSKLGKHRVIYFQPHDPKLQEYKQYFQIILDKCRVLSKDKKATTQQVAIFDSKMILPPSDPDKFIKGATNEQIIAARVNYLQSRQKGDAMKLLGIEIVPTDEEEAIRLQKQAEEAAAAQEPEQAKPGSGKKTVRAPAKSIPQVEPPIKFIPLRPEQYVAVICILVEKFTQPKQLSDLEQAFGYLIGADQKAKLDQTVKAKYQTIFVSAFHSIYYQVNPQGLDRLHDASSVDKKGKPADKKGAEPAVDQNLAIAEKILETFRQPGVQISQYSHAPMIDENVNIIKTMYKEALNTVQFIDDSNFKSITVPEENVPQNVVNTVIDQICNMCGITEPQAQAVQYLLNKQQIQGLCYSLSNKLRDSSKPRLLKLADKATQTARLLAIRSLRCRDAGVRLLRHLLEQLTKQFSQELADDPVNYGEAAQTELENYTHDFRQTAERGLADIEDLHRRFLSVAGHLKLIEATNPTRAAREIGWFEGFLSKYYNKHQIEQLVHDSDIQLDYQRSLVRDIIKDYIDMINIELLPGEASAALTEKLNGEWIIPPEPEPIAEQEAQQQDDKQDNKQEQDTVQDNQDQQEQLNNNEQTEEELQQTLSVENQKSHTEINHSIKLINENDQIDLDDIEAILNGILEYVESFPNRGPLLINYKQEFECISGELQNQYKNCITRLNQLLYSLYRLILREINSKNQEKLFQCLEKYHSLLTNEIDMLNRAYQDTVNELNLPQGDAEEYKSISKQLDLEQILSREIQNKEECLNLISDLHQCEAITTMDKDLILEKMQVNEADTIKAIQESFCLQFIEVSEVPDTSKGAKKGAVIKTETSKYFYYDGISSYINMLREISPNVNKELLSEIICSSIKEHQKQVNESSEVTPQIANKSQTNVKLDKKTLELQKQKEAEELEREAKKIVSISESGLFKIITEKLYKKKVKLFEEHSIEFKEKFIADYIESIKSIHCMNKYKDQHTIFAISLLLLFKNEEDYRTQIDDIFNVNIEDKIQCAIQILDVHEYFSYMAEQKFIQTNLITKDINNLFGSQFSRDKFEQIQKPQEEPEAQPAEEEEASKQIKSGKSQKSPARKK